MLQELLAGNNKIISNVWVEVNPFPEISIVLGFFPLSGSLSFYFKWFFLLLFFQKNAALSANRTSFNHASSSVEMGVLNSRWKLLTGVWSEKALWAWSISAEVSGAGLAWVSDGAHWFSAEQLGRPGDSLYFVRQLSYAVGLKCFCLLKKKKVHVGKIFSAWIIMMFVLGWKNYLLCSNTALFVIIPRTGHFHSH